MSETVVVQDQVFGNFTTTRRVGLGRMSLGANAVLMLLMLIAATFLFFQLWIVTLIVAVLGGVGALLMFWKREGRSFYGRFIVKRAFKRRERLQRTTFVPGPAGFLPAGASQLPGLLARTELIETPDAYGEDSFAILRRSARGKHLYTVVIKATPAGIELTDPEKLASQVAHYGAFIAARAQEGIVKGWSVTIESAEDSGVRVQHMLTSEARRVEANDWEVPEHSRRVMAHVSDMAASTRAPNTSLRVAISFNGGQPGKSEKDRGISEMTEVIRNELPGIISDMQNAGGGTVRACTAQEVIDETRVAFDPTVAGDVERAQVEGDGTGLSFDQAGPVFAREHFDYYLHDRGCSRSWTLYDGPRGTFTSMSLRELTRPESGCLRKRVTLLYRPVPADKTVEVVETEQRNAHIVTQQGGRVSARALQRKAAADQSAREEAAGAGVSCFGMIVTVTTATPEELEPFNSSIPGRVSKMKLPVRIALGNQAATFQAGLPLGLVLPEHMHLAPEIREYL